MGKDLKGKELGKGISQRKNGIYMGRYVDRFQKRKTVYGKTLKELKTKMYDAVAEDNSHQSVKKNLTLKEWFDKWILIYKKDIVRPNTLREYDYIYRAFVDPQLGCKCLTEIKKIDVQELLNSLKNKGYGYERINKVRIIILDMCDRAMEDDYLIKNPARGVKINIPKERQATVLTLEDQEEFFRYSVSSFYDYAFNIQVRTGLRPGELFALTKEDIDLDNQMIDVNKTLVYQKYLDEDCKTFHIEPPKTKTSYRKVPMNSECLEYMKRQFELKKVMDNNYPNGCQFLFTTSLNTPINSQIYSDAIKVVVKQINLKRPNEDLFQIFSGHTFRHTFATRCLEAGIPPKVVQQYLGHASLQMTMDLYTHVTDEKMSMDIERICSHTPQNIVNFEQKVS